MLFTRLVAIIWVLAGFVSGQPTLPADEVESLRVIARSLGKGDWNFSVDPCSGSSGWVSSGWVSSDGYPADTNYDVNRLTCDCTFQNNTICHVVSIILKAQNLSGSVPRDLIRLPFLREIDLTRNNLNGTIPPEWGSMNLVNISLRENCVSGSIPTQLANISSLKKLNLENNQLSGTIPPEFGNLSRIETLTLNSNNLTGELPATLERLSTLIDFRISDNNFRGSIPNFIQNWTNIERLAIQGSGLNGPIPAGIYDSLTNLMDLRISDLSGNYNSAVPDLRYIRGLETLILRSCNIVGEFSDFYNGGISQLKVLDLSFNKLSGPIPDTFVYLRETEYIYLTGNSLSGSLPYWILNYAENVDLSYNNFTPPNSSVCQSHKTNLFASSKGYTPGIVSCSQTTSCEREYYSFHINCGGGEVADGKGTIYETNAEPGGPSNYVQSGINWGFSSTGHFLDEGDFFWTSDSFIGQNRSVIIGDNPQLYADARLSPLSLTYYGFCLRNGNYTVNLHFAEIILSNDRTFYSVGRRLFDVYIQGKRVLKDFNIEREAGGVNIAIRRNFTAVVNDNSLDIRFYWAGKGTSGIQFSDVYGPLISAISVDPNYTPPAEKGDGRISTGAVVGIDLGVALMFLLVLGVLWWKGCLRGKDEVHTGMVLGATGIIFLTTIGTVIRFIKRRYFPSSADEESNYRAVETFLLQHGLLALKRCKYSEIKEMTKSFSDKLGQGGYGSVYKGNLPDGTLVAVKLLSAIDENVEDFINEVASISRTSHVNIVSLLGFCFDRKKRALVYEYMPNKSLDKYISKSGSACCLDLEILYKIAVGVAEGLDYLHRGCNTRIVHFDIKPQNILLDEEFCPKISDFGLAKLCKKKQSLLSVLGTRGTVGYIAPEVFSRNYGGVSHKSDVYSYGMMVLEMVGANMIADHTNETTQSIESYFPDKIYEPVLDKTRQLHGFTTEVTEETARKMLLIGFWCIQTNPLDRPSISTVVEMLEGSLESIQIPPKPVLFNPTLPVLGVSSSFSSYVETQPSAEGVTQTHFIVPENGSD